MFAVIHQHTTPERFIVRTDAKVLQAPRERKDPKPRMIVTKVVIPESPKRSENTNIPMLESTTVTSTQVPEKKKFKIRLSVIKDVPYQPSSQNDKKIKKSKEAKKKQKRINREGMYNNGRWQPEEHQRFIEAIFKYGNEWKQVQKHVGTRSSTQARSHAQKFFVKIKKANVLDFNIDLSRNSIKTLHDLSNILNTEKYTKVMKALNCLEFEKKNISKKKQRREKESKGGNEHMLLSSDSDIDLQTSLNLK
jgi:SHAQKYF class myb-like DNA-binding protein